MVNLKIFILILLFIVVSSYGRRRRRNREKENFTVEGTLFINLPNDIPKPDYYVLEIRVNGDAKKYESRLHWSQCKDSCKYVVRQIQGFEGQRYSVWISLYYNPFGVHSGSPTRQASSTEIGVLKEGKMQDVKYDAVAMTVTLLDNSNEDENQVFGNQPPQGTTQKVAAKVEGTIFVNLADNREPNFVIIRLKLNGEEKYAKRIHWSQCSDNKCPYAMQPINGYVGQTYALGIGIDYKNSVDTSPGSISNPVWSKEIAVLKDGENKQDATFDANLPNVILQNSSNGSTFTGNLFVPPGSQYGKISVTVQGTVLVILSDNRTPNVIIVKLKLKGDGDDYAKRIHWSECSNNKCPYAVRPVNGYAGQTYALGVGIDYDNSYDTSPGSLNKPMWSREMAVLRNGENKQDAKYDARQLNVSLINLGNNTTPQPITVNVVGTVLINLAEDGLPNLPKPTIITIMIKLNGEQKTHATRVRWDQCSDSKCHYMIPRVSGFVDQTYALGVNLFYSGRNYGSPNKQGWSKEIAVLKEGENRQDARYDAKIESVSLLNPNNSQLSVTDNQYPPYGSQKVSVTVLGTVLVTLPDNLPPPDFLIIRLKLNGEPHEFGKQVHWTQCLSNKCEYVIKPVYGYVGQTYALGFSLHYTTAAGINRGSVQKHAWSKEIAVLNEGVNKQDAKYDASLPNVTLVDLNENVNYDTQSYNPIDDKTEENKNYNYYFSNPYQNRGGEKVNVTVNVNGTVYLDLPDDHLPLQPKPNSVTIKLRLNGVQKEYATRIHWSQCSNNKCPYSIPRVSGYVDQAYALGVMPNYVGRNPHNLIWSREIAVLKYGENRQDIKYDAALPNITLLYFDGDIDTTDIENETPLSHDLLGNKTGEKLSVTVHGTMLIDFPNNIPRPKDFIIYVKVHGERRVQGSLIHWSQCPNNRCQYVIRQVNGYVDQKFALGVGLYYTTSSPGRKRGDPDKLAWSKEIGVIKSEENKQDIRYDARLPNVSLIDLSNIDTTLRDTTREITVEGSAIITLPNNVPKPDDFVIYVQVSGTQDRHWSVIKWKECGDITQHPNGRVAREYRCYYKVSHVDGYTTQKYAIGMQLYYSDFGTNHGSPNRFAWSKDIAEIQNGENRQDLKYDVAMPSVTLLDISDNTGNPKSRGVFKWLR